MMTWAIFKAAVLKVLKNKVIEIALAKLIKTSSFFAGGFGGWLAGFVVKHLYNHLAEPIALLVLRKSKKLYDKTEGKYYIAKMEEAKNENDPDRYASNVGRV